VRQGRSSAVAAYGAAIELLADAACCKAGGMAILEIAGTGATSARRERRECLSRNGATHGPGCSRCPLVAIRA